MRSHIWEWLNETPPNEAMQYGSANEIYVVATMVGKIMPVLFPDLTFLWGRCLQCVWQKGWNPIYGGLSWWITPAISRWTGWHTHKPTTESRDKVSFSFTQGIPVYSEFQSGISRSVRYIEQMVLQSEGHLLLCWSPKNGNSKMLRIITFATYLNA